MLGNAVVPFAVRRAFEYLINAATNAVYENHVSNRITTKLPAISISNGSIIRSKRSILSVIISREDEKTASEDESTQDMKLLLIPDAYGSDKPSKAQEKNIVREPIPLARWATPVSKSYFVANRLTKRTADNLHVQLRFERSTPEHTRGYQVSARFVEWMMGFPIQPVHLKMKPRVYVSAS
jgi:hypothetical protein